MAAVTPTGSRRKGNGCWLAEVAAAEYMHHPALHKRIEITKKAQAHQ